MRYDDVVEAVGSCAGFLLTFAYLGYLIWAIWQGLIVRGWAWLTS